jgi:fructose-specific phosphotransferase system IIA component
MTLANLLSAELVVPDMKARARWDAITELVDRLVAEGRIRTEERDQVLDSIKQREQTMSTGIGFGIAIPHASSDKVDEVVAAFGRSSTGIEFDSLDGQPVFFVVLFVVPKDQFQTHLRTLAAIAKFLNDRTVREELGKAENADQILQVFENRAPRS